MRTVVSTQAAPYAVGPYSQAVVVGPFLFTSGQIALDPDSQQMVEGAIEAQVRQVMENLRAVLAAADLDFEDVVKTTIFLKDMEQFSAVNRIYGEYFSVDPPARSTVQVTRLPLDAAVEIEMVAYREEGRGEG